MYENILIVHIDEKDRTIILFKNEHSHEIIENIKKNNSVEEKSPGEEIFVTVSNGDK